MLFFHGHPGRIRRKQIHGRRFVLAHMLPGLHLQVRKNCISFALRRNAQMDWVMGDSTAILTGVCHSRPPVSTILFRVMFIPAPLGSIIFRKRRKTIMPPVLRISSGFTFPPPVVYDAESIHGETI
ncbi:MAG: hypothetical protein ACLFQY_05320 [Desulfococcaceae bacterium]